jgi:hypothetical protein
MFYVVTYTGSGLVTAGVGLLATHLGLTVSVQVFAAVLAAVCLLTLAAARRVSRSPAPADSPDSPAREAAR